MQRSFSYSLLITLFLILVGCQTHNVKKSTEGFNTIVSDSLMPIDSEIVHLYLPYKQQLEKKMNQVISVTGEEMIKNKPESNLTNFLADLLLEEGKRVIRETGKNIEPDISFFNYGGIRTFLPKGEITIGKIFELMPFENEMVILQITGAQMQEFLDIVASKGGESLGGVRFVISGNNAVDIEIGNKPLNPDANYWMITNDYVAAGGDGLEVLTSRKEIIDTNSKIRDVIISYLQSKYQSGEKIIKELDGRITYHQNQGNN